MKHSRLLQANAVFLACTGGIAAISDAVGHFWGTGPWGRTMYHEPLAISSFEAHLLALVLGVLLWRGAQREEKKAFHLLAAVTHFILGGSNMLFFQGAFGALGMVRFGVMITAVHVGFFLAQLAAATKISNGAMHSTLLHENT